MQTEASRLTQERVKWRFLILAICFFIMDFFESYKLSVSLFPIVGMVFAYGIELLIRTCTSNEHSLSSLGQYILIIFKRTLITCAKLLSSLVYCFKKSFYFELIFDLQKSCRNSTKNCPLPRFPSVNIFAFICFMISELSTSRGF